MYSLAMIVVACILLALPCRTDAASDVTISLDGNGPGRVFDGIGGLSAGANSRLLIDYPEPQRSQILDFLFKPNFGASLQVLKVEIGGAMNSTWGSEPTHACTRDEFDHPKAEYYDRGYEWWLMEEAKKRNPDIILESLQWGAPGWIGGGQYYSQDDIDYIAKFIRGARDYHGLTINYQGILNEDSERAKHKSEWIKALRKALDENGLQQVKLVATDSVGDRAWDIVNEFASDPELEKAIYAVGGHYVGYNSSDAAKSAGKPLWSSEDSQSGDSPWARADGYAKLYNRNYIKGRMTKTIICSLITSNFDYLAPFNVPMWANPGLTKACTPWSGHYEVIPPIWVTAHTTQFTKPGWRYLDGACGLLDDTGSYVTLRSPDPAGDYSIIIETMKDVGYQNVVPRKDGDPLPDVPARHVTFDVKSLSGGTVHVWRTNSREQFIQLPDIIPVNGSFSINLEGNSVYTLTTTTGQRKGSFEIPKDSPFPLPYKDDFESYALGKMARYFSDEQGTFVVAERADGHGKCLRQIVPQRGMYGCAFESPWTIIGDTAWKDYEASVDVHIGEKGMAGLYGRVDDPLSRPMPGGYGLTLDSKGAWQLKDTTTLIESGSVKPASGSWHNLKLRFVGPQVTALIDGETVCSITDTFHPRGAVALATSYDYVEFDNFSVKPLKGRAPKPAAGWENLALGKKVTASKELSADYRAANATDGIHANGWCPSTGKVAGEWLEIDLGKETTFDRTIIDQHIPDRYVGGITAYKIQYWNGSAWKDLVIGKNMSVRQTDDFSPVTASKVRLLITEGGEYTGVYEFQVYRRKSGGPVFQ